MRYIWQSPSWPDFTYDAQAIAKRVSDTSFLLGSFLGMLSQIGFDLKSETMFRSMSCEITESAAIEGEMLNRDDVRSSVARRMGLMIEDSLSVSSHLTDARVEMMMDATRGWRESLSLSRLCSWHASLFPSGYSGLVKIQVGQLRDDIQGPMRVVSRYGSLERVHFEAPPAACLERELSVFLSMINSPSEEMPQLVGVALAHLHFLTLHPFDDGNGRLARALSEYLLARMEKSDMRFYSLSSQIHKEKAEYYRELEHAQRNSLDVTQWVDWFLGLLSRSIVSAQEMLKGVLAKSVFWNEHTGESFNEHQKKMLNMLLDGFNGHLTSSKWAKICKVSQDTASREIQTLIDRGILVRLGKGRTTHYCLT